MLSVGSEVKVIIKENRHRLLMGATGNVTVCLIILYLNWERENKMQVLLAQKRTLSYGHPDFAK